MHPLPNHPFGQRAAQAALAAQAQGKFLPMHEMLLERQRTFSQLGAAKAAALGLPANQNASPEVQDAMFLDFAAELGLDLDRFVQDYNSDAVKARIAAETKEVIAIGATGTPASFINGKYLRGAQPFPAFQAKVEQELKAAGGGGKPASP
jgi:protein-disulfide isomerase